MFPSLWIASKKWIEGLIINGPLGSAKLDLKVLLSNQHLNVTNFAKLQVGLVLRNLYTGTYNPRPKLKRLVFY